MSDKFKYSLRVEQKQCLELGILNINQAIIFDLLAHANHWAEEIIIENKTYHWVARQAVASQLPILNLKPDTIYRHLKALHQIGVIEHVKHGKKDCIRMTKKGKSYYVGNKSELKEKSEMNPTKLGSKSENNSEINPTYKSYNTNNSYNNIKQFEENKGLKSASDLIKGMGWGVK